MPRIDLLSLSAEDLAAITNRGTVKRAQKELDEGTVGYNIQENDGEVVCAWTDGIVCRFPAGKTIHEAVCSSLVVGISRHIIRSVFAYQKLHSQPAGTAIEPATSPDDSSVSGSASDDDTALPEAKPVHGQIDWNPGDITDEELTRHFRATVITKARQRFEQGTLVELVRGPKPLARFLDESCTIRFLVPGDVRYITADCAESALGTFVPMAVWAFRNLDPAVRSGIVSIQLSTSEAPVAVLDELDALLLEFCIDGIQGISPTWLQRIGRNESRCREAGLVWLAELLVDLNQQCEMYVGRDGLFDPQTLVRMIGELMIRSRAIRSGTTTVPQLLIRGSRSDRATDLASSRLIGLGCGVRQSRRSVTITAYLQDSDAGGVVGIDRTFADPAADSTDQPRSFANLAQTTVSRGISLNGIGLGQILLKTGRRTAGGRLILPRTSASMSLNPQSFQWEHLRSPLAVEDFAELSARLDLLPPSSLRPRRLTEALHVCPVVRIENVTFDSTAQRLIGTAIDANDAKAQISQPFFTRSQEGFEHLSKALTTESLQPRFVCGHVSRRRSGVFIEPICVVFQSADGKRKAVCPWTDSQASQGVTANTMDLHAAITSPLTATLNDVAFELSELLLNGLRRSGSANATRWSRMATQVGRVGLVKLAERLNQLTQTLSAQAEQIHGDGKAAAAQLLNILMICRLADDIVIE